MPGKIGNFPTGPCSESINILVEMKGFRTGSSRPRRISIVLPTIKEKKRSCALASPRQPILTERGTGLDEACVLSACLWQDRIYQV